MHIHLHDTPRPCSFFVCPPAIRIMMLITKKTAKSSNSVEALIFYGLNVDLLRSVGVNINFYTGLYL